MTDPWERALRAALAPAREMVPTDAELQRVLALDRRRSVPRRTVPRLAVAACAAALVAGGTYAVPATRGAIDDVYSSIAGWFSSEDPGPGRALTPADDAPEWISGADGQKRVVAENGGARLYAVHRGDHLDLGLGPAIGVSGTVEDLHRDLAEHRLVFLGIGGFSDGPIDDHLRRPLMGLVTRSVTRVELRYVSGPPSAQGGLHGGFVVLADARRQPRELVAFDAGDREIDRVDVSDLELRLCTDDRGCPPGRYTLHAPPQEPAR